MSEEGYEAERPQSTFSYIWYTIIWYLIQFALITGLHFLRARKIDQNLLKKAACDTVILTLAFTAVSWSQSMLSYGVFRLPYVVLHVFADLVPTAIWLTASLLSFLLGLGLVQQLYHHLVGEKTKIASLKSQISFGYFTSMGKSQQRIEDNLQRHIKNLFPRLFEKYELQGRDSMVLYILFSVAFQLLQLSTLALVIVEAFYDAGKSCYLKMKTMKVKELKRILKELMEVSLVTSLAALCLMYTAGTDLVRELRYIVWRQADSAGKSSKTKKSIDVNNGASVTHDEDSVLRGERESANGSHETAPSSFKPHHE